MMSKKNISQSFEAFWDILKEELSQMDTIYTLGQKKPNQIDKITDEGIYVTTTGESKLVKLKSIKTAWFHLFNDGILYRGDHKKASYRSSFMMALFSSLDFIDAHEDSPIYVRVKSFEEYEGPDEKEIEIEPEKITKDVLDNPKTHEITHNFIVYLLAKIGKLLGCDIWIANDMNSFSINGTTLGDLSLKDFTIPGLDKDIIQVLKKIDILWLKDKSIVYAGFEVEHTTQIYSGLLRFCDLFLSIPNLNIKTFIIAPDHKKKKVYAQFKRKSFEYLLTQVNSKIDVIFYSPLILGTEAVERIYKMGGHYKIDDFLDNSTNSRWEELVSS